MNPWRVAALFFVPGAALCAPFACGSPPSVARPTPAVTLSPAEAAHAWSKARSVFEGRCVVCHGCYDAPCQLKLGTFEGIDRGATKNKVYDGSRVFAATPTRLGIDAHGAEAWRKMGFHPVLPEGASADARTSLLVRMLDLKQRNPISASLDLSKDFTLDLDRKESCTTLDKFEGYAKEHPLWGMPYAMSGLDPTEDASLRGWVNAGAPHSEPSALEAPVRSSIVAWESFLNDDARKSRLVARYIYEHLFLASLYFEGIEEHIFFRLVRSRTADGAIEEIPTRRPFEDPHLDRVYYRFVRRTETPLEKTHMPYPLSAARLRRFHELFFVPSYTVDQLPSYEPEIAANPFRAFAAIPAQSRYRFMLEEAEFTMMGFIKGPVCRGQVALDVIEDRFWISFLSPDVPWMNEETAFLAGVKQDLDMPAEGGSTALPTLWLRYGKEHTKYVERKAEFMERVTKSGQGINLNLLWDGGGTNANAALTVFRHFDSASIVKGLVGTPPKTSWVIGYPLLERIHYLLVAGFDVFGNVSHQVTTRLYMDFLRMEGEANFLMFLPPARRAELVDNWYRGVSGDAKNQIAHELLAFQGAPNLPYRAHDAENEFFPLLISRVHGALANGFDPSRIEDPPVRAAVEGLGHIKGRAASWMPEMCFVTVAGGASADFTILRNSGHSNVAHLFHEDDRRLKDEDDLSVVRGFLGAYPNAIFEVPRAELPAFVATISSLDSEAAYHALRARFGVLRASERFWPTSDRITDAHRKEVPVSSGLFDYNRLEAY